MILKLILLHDWFARPGHERTEQLKAVIKAKLQDWYSYHCWPYWFLLVLHSNMGNFLSWNLAPLEAFKIRKRVKDSPRKNTWMFHPPNLNNSRSTTCWLPREKELQLVDEAAATRRPASRFLIWGADLLNQMEFIDRINDYSFLNFILTSVDLPIVHWT